LMISRSTLTPPLNSWPSTNRRTSSGAFTLYSWRPVGTTYRHQMEQPGDVRSRRVRPRSLVGSVKFLVRPTTLAPGEQLRKRSDRGVRPSATPCQAAVVRSAAKRALSSKTPAAGAAATQDTTRTLGNTSGKFISEMP
jgi:hypothetical protein